MDTRWIAVFDNHGDMVDEQAAKEMFGFLKWWRPTIRIHGGDCFDFRPLRRKATEEELREGKALDVLMGIDFIQKYKPTHFLRGNHDERLWDLVDPQKNTHAGKRETAITIADDIHQALKDVKCQKIFPYDKRKGVCDIGKLRILHGYVTGMQAAKKMTEVYGACLFGHIHQLQQYTVPSLERKIGRCCGCLCRLDMDYNRGQINTLQQEHGFAYGTIDEGSGVYRFYQAHPVEGSWRFPTEWRGTK
jgi:hypothetical protein